MKSKILLLLSMVLFFASVIVQAEDTGKNISQVQQKNTTKPYNVAQIEADRAFYESLKGVSPRERAIAIKEYHIAKYQKNKNFKDKTKQDNTVFLKELIKNGSTLTNVQENELIDLFESQYLVSVPLKNSKYDGDVAFFLQVANNPAIPQEQKKEIIREYFKNKKEEAEKLIDEKNSKVSGDKSGSWSGVDNNEFSAPTIKK
jgi:hypothetical protein